MEIQNRRRRTAKREHVGSQTYNDHEKILHGFRGKLELAQYKKPKGMSFGHAQNVRHYVEAGLADNEYRHVLMDYEQNKQLKAKMLSRQEAWRRNQVLQGTGFAWAMCGK